MSMSPEEVTGVKNAAGDLLSDDDRLDSYPSGFCDLLTKADVYGAENVRGEEDHCAFFTTDEDALPACGMQLEYGTKPEVCRDYPDSPEKGVYYSNCEGCRLVLPPTVIRKIRRNKKLGLDPLA